MDWSDHDSKWPKASERLVTAGPDWMNNACLNYGLDLHWAYNEGFYRAARLLVEDVVSRSRCQDSLIYPILFLYRHYVEIQLKTIVHVASELYLDSAPDLSKTHRLDCLWKHARPLLEQAWPGEGTDVLDSVEAIISELGQLDPTSTVFRYAYQRDGSVSLEGHTHMNIRNIGDVMAGVHNFLHGCDAALSHMRESQLDWHTEQGNSRQEASNDQH